MHDPELYGYDMHEVPPKVIAGKTLVKIYGMLPFGVQTDFIGAIEQQGDVVQILNKTSLHRETLCIDQKVIAPLRSVVQTAGDIAFQIIKKHKGEWLMFAGQIIEVDRKSREVTFIYGIKTKMEHK